MAKNNNNGDSSNNDNSENSNNNQNQIPSTNPSQRSVIEKEEKDSGKDIKK